jgi:6-phosphogluconate dehydrogenase
MSMTLYDVGLVGLAVMGENLALNMLEKGFSVAVHNRTSDRIDAFLQRAQREGFPQTYGARTAEELVASLKRPRKIIMMVKAGQPVDDTIARLRPLLHPGDMIIDGGNEHFTNTERRARELAPHGFTTWGWVSLAGKRERVTVRR